MNKIRLYILNLEISSSQVLGLDFGFARLYLDCLFYSSINRNTDNLSRQVPAPSKVKTGVKGLWASSQQAQQRDATPSLLMWQVPPGGCEAREPVTSKLKPTTEIKFSFLKQLGIFSHDKMHQTAANFRSAPRANFVQMASFLFCYELKRSLKSRRKRLKIYIITGFWHTTSFSDTYFFFKGQEYFLVGLWAALGLL